MIRQFRLLALPLVLLISLASMRRAAAAGFLHTQGQDIVDEKGRKFLIQGVGLGNWMLPEGYMWKFGPQGDRPRKIEKIVSDLIGPENATRFWSEYRRQYIAETDIKRIAELGFNAVRPALNARLFQTEEKDPTFVEEGFGLLDNLVAWCKNQGIYVIIDMHAAPGGQTGANIDDSAMDQPALFVQSKNQDRLVDLWVKIAGRYKDQPTVAAYDLLNEPLPARTGAAAQYKDQLGPLYERLTKAIRQIDPKHMVTLEGADWANDWSVFADRFDDNLLYQFHYYAWDRPDNLKSINQYLAHRNRLNAPVWVGETGEKDNAIYWATTQYFEANNIGWSFWPWKKMAAQNAPYSIKAPDGWDGIAAYSRGGAKPGKEAAEKTLEQLLQNIRLENCVYFPDVVNALFHRVPGRVEAENFGHAGPNKSYFVKDDAQKAKHYRPSEPVPVDLIEAGGDSRRSEQAIKLTAEEWTAYVLNSQQSKSYAAAIRAKAESTPAVFQVSLNDHAQDLTITDNGWREIKLSAISLANGANRLKLLVKRGTVCFDWISFQ